MEGAFTFKLFLVFLNGRPSTELSFMDLIVILLSFLHPLNAFCLIRIRFDPAVLPMLIAGIFVQPANALIPIPSTLSGRVIGS